MAWPVGSVGVCMCEGLRVRFLFTWASPGFLVGFWWAAREASRGLLISRGLPAPYEFRPSRKRYSYFGYPIYATTLQ